MVNLLKSLFYWLIKGCLKIPNDFCPSCGSHSLRKNGTIHNGKPKNECKKCGRQFVINNTKKTVTQAQTDLIDKLLLERISLRGIARVVGVSWRWLQNYVNHKLAQVSRKIKVSDKPRGRLTIECDELWSFVNSKGNEYWVWLAIDRKTREIERGSAPNLVRHAQVSFVGCYIGDRSRKSAQKLWESLPPVYRQYAVAYTDFWESYKTVIPDSRHRPVPKSSGQTNHIERI